MKPKSTLRSFLLLAGSTLLAVSSLRAASLTWDNGAATGNWNTTDLNWTGSAWSNANPDDAIFDATGVGTVTLTEPITAGSITINTAGYTIDTSTFGLTLNTGITAIESATISGTGGVILGAANAWSVAATKTLTVNSAISGVGFGITKSDTGTLTLSGANTYDGSTAISAGTLSLGAANVIPDGASKGNVSVTGTLDLNTFSETVNGLSGAGTVDTIAGGTPTLTVGGNDQTSSFTGVIKNTTGTLALTKIGTGTLTLSGTNTFSGQLTVENGTLSVATANNISTNGPLGNSALPVILGKTGAQTGTLSYTGGNVTCSKPLTMASGGTGNINVTTSGTSLTLSGAINGGGTLSKSGSGTLILTGATNSYSGGTVINGGTLRADTDAVLGSGGGITFEASATFTPGSVTYARSITLNNGAIASFNGGNPTFSGNVTGTGGVSNLNNFGNQVTFSGTGNTFEGPIRIGAAGSGTFGQAYRFQFSSLADSSTANGTIRFAPGPVTHADGSVFQWNGSTNLTLANRQIEIASSGATPTNGHQIRNNGSGTLTITKDLLVTAPYAQTLALRGTGTSEFSGKISDNPSAASGTTVLTATFALGATTVTLASVQGVSTGASISGTNIAGGTTITAINPSTRVVTLSTPTTGTGSINQVMTVTGVTNPVSVTKNTDAGTWTLSGNNTHSGGTTFSAGKLNINHAGALGTGTLTIGAGTFDNTSGAPITNANNNVIAWNGDATFTGTNSLNLGTGAVTLGGTRNITVNANTLTFGGDISGTSAQEIRKIGSGTLAFTSVNSGYLGKTSVQAGTLQISSIADYNTNSSLGAVASGDIQLGSGTTSGTLNYIGSGHSSNRTFTIGSNTNTAGHTGGGRINVNGGDLTLTASTFNSAQATVNLARTLTLGGSGNGAISGIIQDNSATGPVNLSKADAGIWTISGANTYTGTTSISGGTLRLASISAVQNSSQVNMTGSSTLQLATDVAFTTFPPMTGSSGFIHNIVSDRATAGAGLTHALASINFGNSTFNFTSGANVTSGTAGISFNAVSLGGGTGGTAVLNPTTATLTLGTVTAINATPKTLNLGGTGTGHAVTGAISDGVSIPVSLIKSDTSTWTLSGANTYTGTTTVNGGTLILGVSNCLADTSNVVIGAGILSAAASANDTAGTLDVTNAASTINLGSGATLAFADSSAVTWAGMLNIAGTFVSGSSLRFGDGTGTGLTPAQLASITATGWTGFALDGSGYLTATPTSGAPEIAVNQSGDIPSGGSKDFGTVTLGSNNSLVFTINNTGTAALNLTGTPLVAVSGTNATDFTVTSPPAASVSASGNTTFTVQFAPGGAGARSAVLTIANNDSDEGTFTINVSGTGQTLYDAWAGGALFDADANGDGVKNGMAFLLGAANPNASALGLLPTVTQSGGNLTLTFNSLNAASRGSASLSVEHSSNLGISDPWTAVTVPETSGGPTSGVTFTVTPGSPTNNVTATISSSEAASGKLFGRLKANP